MIEIARQLGSAMGILGVLLLVGCASAPPQQQLSMTDVPTLSEDKGRLYIYRERHKSVWQDIDTVPAITLNGVAVTARPLVRESFVIVDLAPGDYEISAVKQEMTSDFIALPSAVSILPGETKYVRTVLSLFEVPNVRRVLFWVEQEAPSIPLEKMFSLGYAGYLPVATVPVEVTAKVLGSLAHLRRSDDRLKEDEIEKIAASVPSGQGALVQAVNPGNPVAMDVSPENAECARQWTARHNEQYGQFNPAAPPGISDNEQDPPDIELIKNLVRNYVSSRKVPIRWICNMGTQNGVTVTGLQVLRIGIFKNSRWPVRARMIGFADVRTNPMRPRETSALAFDGVVNFYIYRDDFGEWSIRPARQYGP